MYGFENKLFSVLGDSISTLEGYTMPDYAAYYDTEHKLLSGVFTPAYTWWGQTIKSLGGTLLVNNSFLGSTVCRRRGCEIPSYGCSDERTGSLHTADIYPDVIMVFMGMNDWGFGMQPMAKSEADASDLSVFSTAYENMLSKLKSNYPLADIFCLTLPVSNYKNGEPFPYLFGGIHIEEYCKAIRLCSEKQDCHIIDLYTQAEPYTSIDGFHPDAEGMATLSRAVCKSISEFFSHDIIT